MNDHTLAEALEECGLRFEDLEDLVDGELEGEARARAEKLLRSSPEARAWLEARRTLVTELGTLRSSQVAGAAVDEDWRDLAGRIEENKIAAFPSAATSAPRRVPRASWRYAALAATLGLTLGLGFWLGRLGDPGGAEAEAPTIEANASEGSSAMPASRGVADGSRITSRNAMSDAEAALVEVKRSLRSSLDAHRDVLPPAMVESLDANLETIDRSILELRLAIEENPESPELRRALLAYHENEIALLKRVTQAASRL